MSQRPVRATVRQSAITSTRTEDDVPSGVAKGGRDVEQPAWSKGRYGSAVGRAVHGVLHVVDLASGDGLEDAVAAQCVAEGVVELAALVSLLVRSALASDIVQRAAVLLFARTTSARSLEVSRHQR